ncbi:MAG: hypothetical protein IIC10_04450 [Proteobacteria bacterium]|nr:hypothetical protein [Pseudomonadota bacterium]
MALLGFYSILAGFRDLAVFAIAPDRAVAHSGLRLSWYNLQLEAADEFDLRRPMNR